MFYLFEGIQHELDEMEDHCQVVHLAAPFALTYPALTLSQQPGGFSFDGLAASAPCKSNAPTTCLLPYVKSNLI